MGWKLRGSNVDKRKIFFSPKYPYQFWATSSLLLNGCRGLFQERQGLEVNHTPSSAEVKNECSSTSIPPIYLCDLDDETFTFIKIITIKNT
jgi:hypothetical protein